MKLSFEKLNKLTICGWSIWFIVKAFQQEDRELFVTCFFSLLFFSLYIQFMSKYPQEVLSIKNLMKLVASSA